MVPFRPIIAQGEEPFAMLQDLWIKHRDWVFEPIEYSSVDRLVETMDAEIIGPAETRFDELVMRRAEHSRSGASDRSTSWPRRPWWRRLAG